ncbi:hypothetical protein HDV62DRAFT_375092, partial [Trichoderma sp. SZMC 28011]
MKRRKRACQTSIDTHPTSAPEGRPPAGSGSSREKNNSLYSRSQKATAAILADRARGPEKFTLGHRGYTIINQGGFDGSFGNQSKRRIL